MKKYLPFIKVAFIGVLLMVAIVAILEKTNLTNFVHTSKDTSTSTEGPTPDQKAAEDKANADTKKDFIESSKPGATPPTNTNEQGTPGVNLTADKQTSNAVTVFTTLQGISYGTCKLEVANGAKQHQQTVDVMYQPDR